MFQEQGGQCHRGRGHEMRWGPRGNWVERQIRDNF